MLKCQIHTISGEFPQSRKLPSNEFIHLFKVYTQHIPGVLPKSYTKAHSQHSYCTCEAFNLSIKLDESSSSSYQNFPSCRGRKRCLKNADMHPSDSTQPSSPALYCTSCGNNIFKSSKNKENESVH